MRAVIFLIILSFLASNVVNAAMFCCGDVNENMTQTDLPPCHDSDQAESTADVDSNVDQSEPSCECGSCLQKSSPPPDSTLISDFKDSAYQEVASNFPSINLEPLYTPPIIIC